MPDTENLFDQSLGSAYVTCGSFSFLSCLLVLLLLRTKKSLHFCTSALLYFLVISQCFVSITFILQGYLLLL